MRVMPPMAARSAKITAMSVIAKAATDVERWYAAAKPTLAAK